MKIYFSNVLSFDISKYWTLKRDLFPQITQNNIKELELNIY